MRGEKAQENERHGGKRKSAGGMRRSSKRSAPEAPEEGGEAGESFRICGGAGAGIFSRIQGGTGTSLWILKETGRPRGLQEAASGLSRDK